MSDPSGVVKPRGGTQLQSKDIIGPKGPTLPAVLFSKIVLFGHAMMVTSHIIPPTLT